MVWDYVIVNILNVPSGSKVKDYRMYKVINTELNEVISVVYLLKGIYLNLVTWD